MTSTTAEGIKARLIKSSGGSQRIPPRAHHGEQPIPNLGPAGGCSSSTKWTNGVAQAIESATRANVAKNQEHHRSRKNFKRNQIHLRRIHSPFYKAWARREMVLLFRFGRSWWLLIVVVVLFDRLVSFLWNKSWSGVDEGCLKVLLLFN